MLLMMLCNDLSHLILCIYIIFFPYQEVAPWRWRARLSFYFCNYMTYNYVSYILAIQ